MSRAIRVARIIVASPGDVQLERLAAARVVEDVNRGIARVLGLRLDLWEWETDAYPGLHLDGPQGLIDQLARIQDSEILVGIFWKRFGSPTKTAQSGTVHELQVAIDSWRRNGQPQIMMYFNQQPATPSSITDLQQWAAVLQFREDFPAEGLWWDYSGAQQFEALFRSHLERFLTQQFGQLQAAPQSQAEFAAPVFADPVPRLGLLAVLDRDLADHPVVAVVGMSGSGKSYLVSSSLRRRERAGRIYWHDPSADETLDNLLVPLGSHFRLQGPSVVSRCKELLSALRREDSILVIDDYHIVDASTYGTLLDQAARAGAPARLVLLSQVFVEPSNTTIDVHHLSVGGFTADEATTFLAGHGASDIDAPTLQELLEKTDGLPFAISLFYVLTARYNQSPRDLLDGSIARAERIRRWFDRIASSVGSSCYGLLRALSLCSGPFNRGVVRMLANRVGCQDADATFERIQRNLLVQRYSRYSWKLHELIALICGTTIPEPEREEIHDALGQHYASRIASRRARHQVDIWSIRACREFLRTRKNLETGKRLLGDLAAAAKAEGRYELFLELSSPLVGRQNGQHLWIDYHYAHCAYIVGDEIRSLRVLEPIRLAAVADGSQRLRLAATRLHAEILSGLGDAAAGHTLLADAVGSFRATSPGDATLLAHAQGVLAFIRIQLSRFSEADRLLEELLESANRRRDPRGRGVSLSYQAISLTAQGRGEEGTSLVRTAESLFRAFGDRRATAWTLRIRLNEDLRRERLTDASTLFAESQRISEEIGEASLGYRNELATLRRLATETPMERPISEEIERVDTVRRTVARRARW